MTDPQAGPKRLLNILESGGKTGFRGTFKLTRLTWRNASSGHRRTAVPQHCRAAGKGFAVRGGGQTGFVL